MHWQSGILPMRIDQEQLIETASQLGRGHLGIVNRDRYRCKGDGDSLQDPSNDDHRHMGSAEEAQQFRLTLLG